MNKSVYVIILNYNHREDLKETILSFETQDYSDMVLVVSDNGSSDDSLEWLRKEKPGVIVLDNKQNLGWAEGNNVGMQYAVERSADYILLANNDLSFRNPKLISDLVKKTEELGPALMGVKQYFYDQPRIVYNEGRYLLDSDRSHYNPSRTNISNQINSDTIRVVDYVPGSFLLIPRIVIDNIGMIDSTFFLYAEDTDFGLRAWNAGYPSLISSNLDILHKVSATSGSRSRLKLYYQTRNVWRLWRKHSSLLVNSWRFIFIYHIKWLKLIAALIVEGKKEAIAGLIKGYLHGLLNSRTGIN